MQFSGPKAAESLTGLVTNDVLSLRDGQGQYACALTPKGRIIADVRVLAIGGDAGAIESLLVDATPAAGVGFSAMIRKYVNPRLAKYVDVTATTSCLTLVGGGAIALLRTVGFADGVLTQLTDASPFSHLAVTIGDIETRLVMTPELGLMPAIDLHVANEHRAPLEALLIGAGAVHGAEAEWHRLRVLAGRPEWGIDMDEGTLAQEANMDALQAISYKKGCYTGQETVARVHFRGHVNRTLRQVRFTDGAAPSAGTSLMDQNDAVVGDARSSALASDGVPIGIAMVRREVGAGAALRWSADSGETHGLVVLDAPSDD